MVQVGSLDRQNGLSPRVPGSIQRSVRHRYLSIEMLFGCVVSGYRIEIVKSTFSGEGLFIATRDLNQVLLPNVIRALACAFIPGSEVWAKATTQAGKSSPRSSEFIAQLYWFERLSWWRPRSAVMDFMNWSRTNSNWHIKKLIRLFPLPGAHAHPID